MLKNVLISDKWLKEFSPIPLNFNTKEVQNFVKIAELIWIKPILGDAFYEELLYQVEKNEVSDENSTLFTEALYPLLGFTVAYEALPTLWLHVSEVSITKGSSENSTPATLKDMTYYEQFLRRQIEARKDFLIQFLCSHQDSFPIFNPKGVCPCCDNCCDSDAKLNSPNPNFEIYTPKKLCTTLL